MPSFKLRTTDPSGGGPPIHHLVLKQMDNLRRLDGVTHVVLWDGPGKGFHGDRIGRGQWLQDAVEQAVAYAPGKPWANPADPFHLKTVAGGYTYAVRVEGEYAVGCVFGTGTKAAKSVNRSMRRVLKVAAETRGQPVQTTIPGSEAPDHRRGSGV